MFFEKYHSLEEDEFYFKIFRNQTFPIHIHRSFEFFMQLRGSSFISINGISYTLLPGEAVLIFPYQHHFYKKIEDGEHNLCIFSPELVPDFYRGTLRMPTDSSFTPIGISSQFPENRFLQRAFLYNICGQFEKNRIYVESSSSTDNNIFDTMLLYINEHYLSSCHLKEAAKEIKYDYTYISKLFKRRAGITFNQYVNLLRIRESQKLLSNTKKSIEEITFLCGYTSTRSFHRNFLEITGTTPTDFRKKIYWTY